MMNRMFSRLLTVFLFLSWGTVSATAGVLFFDDFEGNKLDASQWGVKLWDGGDIKVTVANSKVTSEKMRGCRDGILTKTAFRADPAYIITRGVAANTQFEHALHFAGVDNWESMIEYVYDGPGTSSYWLIGPGQNPVTRLDTAPKTQFTNGGAVLAIREGQNYQFYVGKKDATGLSDFTLDYEQKIDLFKGDFQVFLYACAGAGNSWSLDSITVADSLSSAFTGPTSVEKGDKLSTTWAAIKSR
ncbi:hypothetical protein HYR99_41235 [Candidatus Poribacteria bacterium]|nr:hypothetical protein [Candidatus Poribacteria bacterium]